MPSPGSAPSSPCESRITNPQSKRWWVRLHEKGGKRRVSRTHRQGKEMWCYARDEGGPLEAGSQVQASNRCKLQPSRAAVVLCQEGARAPCCTRDEGGPFGAVL